MQLRVACLGPKYSYSHLASVAKFGESVEHVPVGSIAAVFEEVNRRHVQFGIVPLENSTDGRIADTLDMFVRLPGLKICAEVRFRFRHCLLGKGDGSDVRRLPTRQEISSAGTGWGRTSRKPRWWTSSPRPRPPRSPSGTPRPPRSPASPPPTLRARVLVENIEDQANNSDAIRRDCRARREAHRSRKTMILGLSNQAGHPGQGHRPLPEERVNMTWIESFPTAEITSDLQPLLPLLRRRRRPRRGRGRSSRPWSRSASAATGSRSSGPIPRARASRVDRGCRESRH